MVKMIGYLAHPISHQSSPTLDALEPNVESSLFKIKEALNPGTELTTREIRIGIFALDVV